jgi:hypothetical protein
MYLLKCKMRFFPLKFCAKICAVILNIRMKRQTGLLWTRMRGAKLRVALPNCHVRSPFFRRIMLHRMVIPYWHFGKTNQSHLSRNPKERTQLSWRYLTQSFFFWWGKNSALLVFVGLWPSLIFKRSVRFQKLALSLFSGKEASYMMDSLVWVILIDCAP